MIGLAKLKKSKMKKLQEKQRCLLCDGDALLYRKGNIKTICSEDLKITDNQYGKHWQLWRCQDCEVVFAYPMPDEEYLVQLYKEMKDEEYGYEEEGRKKNFSKILDRIEQLIKGKGRLLDIGAASGMLLEIASDRGWDVEGIEISLDLYQKGIRKNLRIYNRSIENYETECKYDVITAIDVIEHLNKPQILMEKSWNLLRGGGIICLVTPNISSLAEKLFGKYWWHYRPPHLYYFNCNSIAYLLKKYNFEILMIKHYVWHFSLYYLFSRLKIKYGKKLLKSLVIPLNLLDSLEIYARKIDNGN